tara:strand:- start:1426 stop:1872 length:447 start_codon:yes stop_codon:yes gene_type:complete
MNKLLFLFIPLFFACNKDSNISTLDELQIGDFHEGGIIFYLGGSGNSGMVVTAADIAIANWWEAVEIVENHSSGGFNDWQLPTIYQLQQIYDTVGQSGGNSGNFEMSKYWSSTLHSGNNGYAFNFGTGESNIGWNGILNCRVRAILSF